MDKARQGIDGLKTSLSALESSGELSKLNALLSEKNSLLEAIAAKKNEARICFSSVSRQLEKLEKLVSGGNWQLEKNDAALLSLYVRDLLEAARQDAERKKLKKLVAEAANAMQAGKLHLKPSDYNKKLSALKGFSQGRLAKLADEAIELEARQAGINELAASIKVGGEINSIKEKLKALNAELSQLEGESASTSNSLNELIEGKKALKEKTRKSISAITGKKITIN
ncbi:hypothetical protein HZB89_02055 [archaeon]|nr:hypothetical protein [archaeon]